MKMVTFFSLLIYRQLNSVGGGVGSFVKRVKRRARIKCF
jgi:hypothetical protein